MDGLCKARALATATASVLFALLFVYIYVDYIWSGSMDLPHHVLLISYIMEHGVPDTAVASLSEMATYPPGSHIAAALVGRVHESPIEGAQVIALLSVFGCWCAIANLLALSGTKRAVLAFALTSMLLAINALSANLELAGSEIISHYFYAQIVGQAIVLSFLAIAAHVETSTRRVWATYSLLMVGSAIAVDVHIVPALILAATSCFLIIADLFSRESERRNRVVAWGSACLVAIAVIFWSDRYFQSMLSLGVATEGLIPLRLVHDFSGLLLLSITTLLVSGALLYAWIRQATLQQKREYITYKYLGAMGAAASLLCIGQTTLHALFGFGSGYACYKYVFVMDTLLAVQACLVAATFLARQLPDIRIADGRMLRIFAGATVPLFAFVASTSVVHHPKIISAKVIDEARVTVGHHHRSSSLRLGRGQDIALGIRDIYPAGNYLISLVSLGGDARSANNVAALSQRPFPSPDLIGRIYTTRGEKPWDVPCCRESELSSELVVLDGQCVLKQMQVYCGGIYDFSDGSRFVAGDARVEGFSHAEPDGAWSLGDHATFSCRLRPGQPSVTVTLVAAGFVMPNRPQHMQVDSAGEKLGEYEFSIESPVRTLRIIPPHSDNEELRLEFRFFDMISPRAAGLNSDERQIAVKFQSLKID